ncbi:ABC transporter permease [Kozakia baliensis]|uniref:ABC transporter permease n=1 Tax=Kozakia baliensis TaxID=153496 RepID=UPI00087A1626|nr:ABC transporter permease [Kozakia baliensis]AOX20420.1 permease [Kozakia baliensis]
MTKPHDADVRREPTLDLSPLRGLAQFKAMGRDFAEGLRLLPLALALGWLDVKMRYRGSMLGPFWLTISTAVMVAAFGVLYAKLFHLDVANYLPFLSLSLVLWGYISTMLAEATTVFTQESGLIHATRMALSVYVLRAIVRNVLVLLHNVAVVIVVFVIFHVHPAHLWQVPLAALLWLVDSMAATFILGVLGARFRDIPPIVTSIIQVFFFITPIIWHPELLGGGKEWLLLDPFFPILQILRAPFLGEVTGRMIWAAALAHSVVLCIAATGVFSRFRARIAYWV